MAQLIEINRRVDFIRSRKILLKKDLICSWKMQFLAKCILLLIFVIWHLLDLLDDALFFNTIHYKIEIRIFYIDLLVINYIYVYTFILYITCI